LTQATLHQLRVFEAVARHNSFTRAAEELFLTQPTISMQVKQLAKVVGLPLFEQIGKRLYLTTAGKELFSTCKVLFEHISEFESTIANLKGLKQGTLRLSVITTAKYIIPRLLGLFSQRYPGVDISLKVTNHESISERLINNQDDLYVMSQLPQDFDVEVYPFMENPLIVLAPRSHPLVNQKNIPLKRLANELFIMREPGSGTRQAVQKLFEEHDIKVRVKLDLGSNEAIKQAIAGGLGISVLSRHTLTSESMNGEIAILDVEHFPIRRHWYVVYPVGKQLSIIASTFFDYLQNEGKAIAEQTFLVNS